MADEINLSLEETNAIRRQLGLKPIEPGPKSEQKRQRIERRPEPKETKTDNGGFQFMDNDKVSGLRKRLASLRNSPSSSHVQEDDKDWLSKIGTQKRHKPIKVIHEDEPEEELPSLRISHGIDEIDSKNGVVLTLKEQSLNDEDGGDDILENTVLTQSQRDRENIRLKKLNKHRKFKPLQVSSFDLDKDERSKDNDETVVTVGGENKVTESKPAAEGKIKVEFDEQDDEDDNDHPTDFQPVKIKKRSKRDVKSRVKLPSKIQPVALIDEDEDTEEAQEQISVASRPLLKNRIQTPQEIAQQIQREKLERQDRSANLAQVNKNSDLVIDENVQFLESLRVNIVENENKEQEQKEQEGPKPVEVAESSVPATTESQALDFSTGLASTLHFLQKKELLPSSNDVNQDPNAEINLVYRDEMGTPLTTKEAYKRLSQRFHGTKSNKRKREKFESKLRARHNGNTNNSERELEL
ncbi:ZYRO0F12496p [Zygosaccharomyces rouxii]|uniref:ZYRO0F12496p n=1 Tax=Zygosaccharomyces rouxii (strain ATCC 2623 / CBS 732 / NBRC 1130 / NCYC 568 / NRRL Y-229) TaxID=559307 RepID=C5DYF0_ZYGRC|nr:uncharacterized protein ZYRO0F12496g [Zygosaccharomyces rouxii]KAH9199568.1 SART-1 family-domain-containing protein [Zygosaccharomyces rouxii]CAR28811.1 ZYRO0F12496p [Zygosaccharomyces rouxii]